MTELQSRRFLAIVRDRWSQHTLDAVAAQAAIVSDAFDFPPVDVIEENFETYFYITKKGMDSHLPDDT